MNQNGFLLGEDLQPVTIGFPDMLTDPSRQTGRSGLEIHLGISKVFWKIFVFFLTLIRNLSGRVVVFASNK